MVVKNKQLSKTFLVNINYPRKTWKAALTKTSTVVKTTKTKKNFPWVSEFEVILKPKIKHRNVLVKRKNISVISGVIQKNLVWWLKPNGFRWLLKKGMVVKTNQISVISVVIQKFQYVGNKKRVRWLKPTRFGWFWWLKPNRFQWFRWLLKKGWWLKPNRFRWFRWLLKKYGG